MNELKYTKFKDINIDDPFFDSLKQDYAEFTHWFAKKGKNLHIFLFQIVQFQITLMVFCI